MWLPNQPDQICLVAEPQFRDLVRAEQHFDPEAADSRLIDMLTQELEDNLDELASR